MVACFRIGAVALPCNEQLRAKDLRLRLDAAAAEADRRRRAQRGRARGRRARLPGRCTSPTTRCSATTPAPADGARPDRPVPDHVHERHDRRAEGDRPRTALPARPAAAVRALARRAAGRPRLVHGRERLVEVRAQRVHRAVDPRRRRAPSRRPLRPAGAAARSLNDERVNVLCMAPTEYRVIAKRTTLAPLPHIAIAGRGRRGAEPGGARARSRRRRASRSATATARPRPAS